jgi:hypothetical protein
MSNYQNVTTEKEAGGGGRAYLVRWNGEPVGIVTKRPNLQGSDRLAGNRRSTGWEPEGGGIFCETLEEAAQITVDRHVNPRTTPDIKGGYTTLTADDLRRATEQEGEDEVETRAEQRIDDEYIERVHGMSFDELQREVVEAAKYGVVDGRAAAVLVRFSNALEWIAGDVTDKGVRERDAGPTLGGENSRFAARVGIGTAKLG